MTFVLEVAAHEVADTHFVVDHQHVCHHTHSLTRRGAIE